MTVRDKSGRNQKQKLLYLAKIFHEETDENHGLRMETIIDKLTACDVIADRRTLYDDFEELRHFGIDIVKTRSGRNIYYHLEHRKFELPELKLLVDSVQSARFITDGKSNDLIKKLESLVSKHQGRQLHRQVVISGRIKAMNESIYYNVDTLHTAIDLDRQISFQYCQWNTRKEMVPRRNEKYYRISPWGLVCDNEYYYLVGYDSEAQKIKHYRIDKMRKINIIGKYREGKSQYKAFDIARYSRSLFGFFGGEIVNITLEAEKSMVGIIIDRFGKDIIIIPVDEDHFRTHVNVAVSNQFFGWIMSLGDGVRLVGPERVIEQLRAEIHRLNILYEIGEN